MLVALLSASQKARNGLYTPRTVAPRFLSEKSNMPEFADSRAISSVFYFFGLHQLLTSYRCFREAGAFIADAIPTNSSTGEPNQADGERGLKISVRCSSRRRQIPVPQQRQGSSLPVRSRPGHHRQLTFSRPLNGRILLRVWVAR